MRYAKHHNVINVQGHVFVFNELFANIKKWIGRDISKYYDTAFAAPHIHDNEDEEHIVLNIKRAYANDPSVLLLSKFMNFRFTMRPKLTLFLPNSDVLQASSFLNRRLPPEGPTDEDQQRRDNCTDAYQFPVREEPYCITQPPPPESSHLDVPMASSTPIPVLASLSGDGDSTSFFNIAEPSRITPHSGSVSPNGGRPSLKRRAEELVQHIPVTAMTTAYSDDDDDSLLENDSERSSHRSNDEESILDVDEIRSDVASTLRSSFIGEVKKMKLYAGTITRYLVTIAERILNNDRMPRNANTIIENAHRIINMEMVIAPDNLVIPSPINEPNRFKEFLYTIMTNALRVGDYESILQFIHVLRSVSPTIPTDDFEVEYDQADFV